MAYAMMALASVIGGIIQPLTGFGTAVILMIAAAAYYDITIAPTLAALICVFESGVMSWLYRRHIELKRTLPSIALYTVCSLAVISLLGSLDLRVLHGLFGAFLVALSVYFLFFAKRVRLTPSLGAGMACSAFSGCCAGAFTVGGPMMALYFVAVSRDKDAYVGNMQFLFFTTNAINFAMRVLRGYYSAALLPVSALGVACVLLGLWIGMRLSRRMSGDVARQAVYIAVGISGLTTLAEQLLP